MTDQFTLSEQTGLTEIAPRVDLTGRVALITGGADGIGRAVAKAYHHFGAHVIVIDIQQDKLDSLKAELGDRVSTLKFDLSTREDQPFEDLATFVKENSPTGGLDIYLINAGVIKTADGPAAKKIATTPIKEFDVLSAVNLRSHVVLYQKLLPLLQKSDAGRIILTSSPIVGRKDPASANYAWTKKALEDEVAMWRQEVRADANSKDIKVAGYVPPPVQAWLRAHWKNEPLYCNPMPEDVVELPLRLASPSFKDEYDGQMFAMVDKRRKNIQPADGGEPYDANNRTQNGFDLGINVRAIGEGGGTEGKPFLPTYDTWHARQLLGMDPVPPLDENVRLRSVLTPPEYISRAMKDPSPGMK